MKIEQFKLSTGLVLTSLMNFIVFGIAPAGGQQQGAGGTTPQPANQSTTGSAFSWKKFGKHFAQHLARGLQGAGNGIASANRYQNYSLYGNGYGNSMPAIPTYRGGYAGSGMAMNTTNFNGRSGTTTAQPIGDLTFINGPGGSGTAQRIGNTTFVNGPFSSATIQKIGNMDFINGSNGYNATAQTIGNTTFINGTRGSETATTIGNTTYIHGPGTASGTINRIGNTSFGNFNY